MTEHIRQLKLALSADPGNATIGLMIVDAYRERDEPGDEARANKLEQAITKGYVGGLIIYHKNH